MTKEEMLDYRKRKQKLHTDLVDLVCGDTKNDNEYLRNLIIAQEIISNMISSFVDITYDSYEKEEESEDEGI